MATTRTALLAVTPLLKCCNKCAKKKPSKHWYYVLIVAAAVLLHPKLFARNSTQRAKRVFRYSFLCAASLHLAVTGLLLAPIKSGQHPPRLPVPSACSALFLHLKKPSPIWA